MKIKNKKIKKMKIQDWIYKNCHMNSLYNLRVKLTFNMNIISNRKKNIKNSNNK